MTDEPRSEEGASNAERPKRRRRRRRPAGGTPKGAGGSPKGGETPKAAGVPGGGTTAGASGGGTKGGASSEKKQGTSDGRKKAGASRSRRRGKPRPGPAGIPTTKEVSAGGVVYRRTSEGTIEVVLASRRTRRGDLAWGLAKGGIETGESKDQAAIREVREETGLTAVIEADLGDTKYMYVWEDVRIRKTVHFFLMRHTGGDPGDRDDEMEEIRWFPMERAVKRAAYRGERDMLTRADEMLR